MHYSSPLSRRSGPALVTRQRFGLIGAVVVASVIPFLLRLTVIPDPAYVETSKISFAANFSSIIIATWIRLSVGTFPGTRAGTLIAPAVAASHGVVLAFLLMTRLPYDRLGILLGFLLHLVWAVGLHLAVHRRVRRRFAVVPFGAVDHLEDIERVDWSLMTRPDLGETSGCDAVVADFSADLPAAWERFLADAALTGRVVYQVKQLSEITYGPCRGRPFIGE